MKCPPDSVMVIHGGGIYGDKEKTIKRWISNYHTLPNRVKRRLVLENCEKCFHIKDCNHKVQIPITYNSTSRCVQCLIKIYSNN